MFLFLRLVLAHVIADFPLQFNALYRIKVAGFAGQLLHGLIVGISMVVFGFPYLKEPLFWVFVSFIVITHIVQDTNKILFNRKNSEKENIWFFLLDQVFHIGFIALCLFLPFSSPEKNENLSYLLSWYYNDRSIIFLVCLTYLSFGCVYFIPLVKSKFLRPKFCSSSLTSFDRWYGTAERALVFICICAQTYSALIIFPAAILLKIAAVLFTNGKVQREDLPASTATTISGFLLSILFWGIYTLCG